MRTRLKLTSDHGVSGLALWRAAGERAGWLVRSPVASMRVLIVEDELVVAIHVEAALSEEGHQIVGIARGSEAALGLGQRLRPDVAFVDMNLADGETGPEIARRLKDMGIPVLFMTANAGTLPEGMAGALGVIPKPVAEHVLRGVIRWIGGQCSEPPEALILNR